MYYFLSFLAGVICTLLAQHIHRAVEDFENFPYRDYDED